VGGVDDLEFMLDAPIQLPDGASRSLLRSGGLPRTSLRGATKLRGAAVSPRATRDYICGVSSGFRRLLHRSTPLSIAVANGGSAAGTGDSEALH
jgi:hypothetical protein